MALVDNLRPNEVAGFTCGGSKRIGPCGELLSMAARACGAAGCLTDGFVRDIRQIRSMAGDLVFGDDDGALEQAFAKVEDEDRTSEELAAGAKLSEVFARYKIL